jgi:hypothetical protein
MESRNGFLNDGNAPLCRFGPGGDYVKNWPAGTYKAKQRPIGSVLDTIAKMLDTVISDELMANSTIEKIHSAIQNAQLSDSMEYEIEYEKSNHVNAAAVTGAKISEQFTAEPMLFDNAAGAFGHSGNKQNNGVRAHRKLKRKRPAFGRDWQGSLFDAHQQSVKVA